jgi:hypothetical protein
MSALCFSLVASYAPGGSDCRGWLLLHRFWLIQWYFFQNPTGWIVSNGVGLLSHCFVLLFSFVASTLVQRTVLKPHKGYCSFWPPIMFNPNPRPRLIRMIWALFDIN